MKKKKKGAAAEAAVEEEVHPLARLAVEKRKRLRMLWRRVRTVMRVEMSAGETHL